MKYLPLEDCPKAWVFRHKDMPVPPQDLALIKPLAPLRAADLWRSLISKQANHPDHFDKSDWPAQEKTWLERGTWQQAWESDDPALPALVVEHFPWDDNTVVFFCYDSEQVLETTWEVFKRHWKNFLFYDDGPLLVGRKRRQVAQFFNSGEMAVGNKPG